MRPRSRTTRPEGSGTVDALDRGIHFLGKKVLEEAGEVWIAAEHQGDAELAEEASQLLYWLQVMLVKRGLTLDDVYVLQEQLAEAERARFRP